MAPPIDTLEAFGVVAAPIVRVEASSAGAVRAESSSLAVMPRYLLALEPAVILLAAIAAFVLVLLPRTVFAGRSISPAPAFASDARGLTTRAAEETVRA